MRISHDTPRSLDHVTGVAPCRFKWLALMTPGLCRKRLWVPSEALGSAESNSLSTTIAGTIAGSGLYVFPGTGIGTKPFDMPAANPPVVFGVAASWIFETVGSSGALATWGFLSGYGVPPIECYILTSGALQLISGDYAFRYYIHDYGGDYRGKLVTMACQTGVRDGVRLTQFAVNGRYFGEHAPSGIDGSMPPPQQLLINRGNGFTGGEFTSLYAGYAVLPSMLSASELTRMSVFGAPFISTRVNPLAAVSASEPEYVRQRVYIPRTAVQCASRW